MSEWQFIGAVVFAFGFLAGAGLVWLVYIMPDRKARREVMAWIEAEEERLRAQMIEEDALVRVSVTEGEPT